MEYVYAAMLLHSAGKTIDEKSITGVLEAAGVDVDAARVKGLVASLASVDIEEAMSTAIAAPVAAAPAAGGSGGGSDGCGCGASKMRHSLVDQLAQSQLPAAPRIGAQRDRWQS